MNNNLTTADANAAVVKHVAQHIDDILFGDINAPMTEEETFVELSRILSYYGMPSETVEECAHTIMDMYEWLSENYSKSWRRWVSKLSIKT